MSAEMSVPGLLMQASPVVQLVMLALLAASVASWTVVFQKRRLLAETRENAEWFEESFWSGGNLTDIYRAVMRRSETPTGIESLFRTGFEEYQRQRKHPTDADDVVNAVQRAMRATLVREIERLENGLALLATVGSTSPYVGLFGTVWGIMAAFIALGNMKSATLQVVAPPIAEALIATAMGLFAAIPAVIFYNLLSHRVDNLEGRYNAFMDEFAGIVQRGISQTKHAEKP